MLRSNDEQDVTLSNQDFPALTGPGSDRPMTGVIADQLAQRIGTDRFDLWFSEQDCIRQTSSDKFRNCIEVSAENSFSLQRIQNTFGRDIRTVVDRVCGPHFVIDYQVKSIAVSLTSTPVRNYQGLTVDEPNSIDQTGPANATNDLTNLIPNGASDSPVSKIGREKSTSESNNRRRNLSSFWFGDENRLAEASVEQLFERPGQFSPFLVYGPTGSGKTHLLEAIANDYRHRLRLRRVVMLSAEQFTSLFVSSLRGGTGLPMFRRKYRELDLLIIDDIQFLAGKRATISEFQHTVDNLIRIGKQVIIASDRPPVELISLGGELGTRLTAGLSCPLRYPGRAGRIKIARQMCVERNMNLANPVIELICDRLTRDVRRISGALNRLHALSLSRGARITTEMAQNELCDLFSISSGHSTSMLSIETAVCEFCGVKPADLKSSSRHKQISSARMLAMYLSRQYTSSAFSEIGDYFGGRSHSTVIAAQKRVHGWLEKNSGVSLPHATCRAKDVISRLESNLRIG